MTDRIEIERYFSSAKRRNGMGSINKKREDTSLSSIAMSVLVTNIFGTFKSAIEEYTTTQSSTSVNRKRATSAVSAKKELLTKHYIGILLWDSL